MEDLKEKAEQGTALVCLLQARDRWFSHARDLVFDPWLSPGLSCKE